MLAQSFISADELGITDAEQRALVTVLGMMERGEIADSEPGASLWGRDVPSAPVGFNMASFFAESDCGTIACICGWAIAVGGLNKDLMLKRFEVPALDRLFDPSASCLPFGAMAQITTPQAARALRNYLTTGEPNWPEAIA
jgi:hypothetical protein